VTHVSVPREHGSDTKGYAFVNMKDMAQAQVVS
jgi:hypothetical protein